MSGRKFVAIGDIHGEYDKLNDLISKINEKVDIEKATLVFLGDYVDGGPRSREVVAYLKILQKLYPHYVFLLGNHEVMLMDAIKYGDDRRIFDFWYMQGGKATLASYQEGMSDYAVALGAGIANMEIDVPWFSKLVLSFETDKYFFVHAGVMPNHPPHVTSAHDKLWIRDFFINSRYDWGKKIIFGHTYNPKPIIMPNKIGIDTMAHGRGVITAVVLDEDDTNDFYFIQSKE